MTKQQLGFWLLAATFVVGCVCYVLTLPVLAWLIVPVIAGLTLIDWDRKH